MPAETIIVRSTRQPLWRRVVVRVMALAVLIAIMIPHHGQACVDHVSAMPDAAVMQFDGGDASNDSDGAWHHATCSGCPCHGAMFVASEAVAVALPPEAAAIRDRIDQVLPACPANLPFKPPQA